MRATVDRAGLDPQGRLPKVQIRRVRKGDLSKVRDVMEQTLREQFGDRLTWIQPKGGFFLWAKLPDGYECESLLANALEQGVLFVIGSAFCVDGSGHDRIRLSFSWPPAESIREGARRLAAAMSRDPVATEITKTL